MESENLKKVKDYRKQLLQELYDQQTDAAKDLFNRMYVSVDEIPEEKIDWAIQQCERTLEKRNNVQ